jgi:hypothetical protein
MYTRYFFYKKNSRLIYFHRERAGTSVQYKEKKANYYLFNTRKKKGNIFKDPRLTCIRSKKSIIASLARPLLHGKDVIIS